MLSYLAAGPVTEADLLRLYPWPDATVVGELGADELRKVAQTPWPERWTALGFNVAGSAVQEPVVLAVLEGDTAKHVERVLDRGMGWQPTGIGLREAVREALR